MSHLATVDLICDQSAMTSQQPGAGRRILTFIKTHFEKTMNLAQLKTETTKLHMGQRHWDKSHLEKHHKSVFN